MSLQRNRVDQSNRGCLVRTNYYHFLEFNPAHVKLRVTNSDEYLDGYLETFAFVSNENEVVRCVCRGIIALFFQTFWVIQYPLK